MIPNYTTKTVRTFTQGNKPYAELAVEVDGWGSFEHDMPLTKGGKPTKAGQKALEAEIAGMAH